MATRRKARRKRKNLTGAGRPAGLFVLLGLIVIACAACFYWATGQLAPLAPGSKAKVLVKIPSGASAETVATLLARHGIVRSRYSVLLAARLSGDASKLKPGVYSLSPADSPQSLLDQIEGGHTALVRVTFPEGFTLRQCAIRLQNRRLVNDSDFLSIAQTQGRTFHCADGFTPPTDNLEGYLFPETYYFAPNEPAREMVQAMLDRFDQEVVQANPDVRDWRRPVILGSLIEREAEVPKDRPLIAAVLDNRLRLGMPLQIDATVEYALPEHKARLLYSDLRIPSPYNTYLHRGLPPGPICNPGLPSIEAALHPAKVGYLYYVAGPGGAHVFSDTLAAQDRNIAAVRNGRVPT